MQGASFRYRILIVEDNASLREMAKTLLQTKGYEVLCAEDGFEGLLALKRSLPDAIISGLSMPNMDGFEFLSVVRRRFPSIPVIVISSEFTGLNVPESVLADALFPKGGCRLEDLFQRVEQFLIEIPTRPRVGKPPKAAIWVKNSGDMVAVTCTDCIRTFPVEDAAKGVNEVPCDYCPALIQFELIGGVRERSRPSLSHRLTEYIVVRLANEADALSLGLRRRRSVRLVLFVSRLLSKLSKSPESASSPCRFD